MLGLSRQRVYQLTSEPDFPAPEVVLATGRVWNTDAVRRWAAAHGRTISVED